MATDTEMSAAVQQSAWTFLPQTFHAKPFPPETFDPETIVPVYFCSDIFLCLYDIYPRNIYPSIQSPVKTVLTNQIFIIYNQKLMQNGRILPISLQITDKYRLNINMQFSVQFYGCGFSQASRLLSCNSVKPTSAEILGFRNTWITVHLFSSVAEFWRF